LISSCRQSTRTIAERAVQLGGVAEGAVRVVVTRSELSPYPLRIDAGVDHVRALSDSLATFAVKMRCSIAEADQALDPVTVDILTEVPAISRSCYGWSRLTHKLHASIRSHIE
jgi:DNA-binding ferritin-like protein